MRECAACGGVYDDSDRHQCARPPRWRWRRILADIGSAAALVAVTALIAYGVVTDGIDWGKVLVAGVFGGVMHYMKDWWADLA